MRSPFLVRIQELGEGCRVKRGLIVLMILSLLISLGFVSCGIPERSTGGHVSCQKMYYWELSGASFKIHPIGGGETSTLAPPGVLLGTASMGLVFAGKPNLEGFSPILWVSADGKRTATIGTSAAPVYRGISDRIGLTYIGYAGHEKGAFICRIDSGGLNCVPIKGELEKYAPLQAWMEADGDIWLLSVKGVFGYDGKKVRTLYPRNPSDLKLFHLAPISPGRLAIGGSKVLLIDWTKGVYSTATVSLPPRWVTPAMGYASQQGLLWVPDGGKALGFDAENLKLVEEKEGILIDVVPSGPVLFRGTYPVKGDVYIGDERVLKSVKAGFVVCGEGER